MRKFLLEILTAAAFLLALSSCYSDNVVVSSALSVEVNGDMELKLVSKFADRPIVEEWADFGSIKVNGEELDFKLLSSSSSKVNDEFGKGRKYTFHAETEDGLYAEDLHLSVYEKFPDTILAKAVYTNNSGETVKIDSWSLNEFDVIAEDEAPWLWSFMGESTGARASWVFPLEKEDFYQRNYMGMNNSDYGGGIPVVCLWRKDSGIATGHLSNVPELVSLPVKMDDGKAEIALVKEYTEPVEWADSETFETLETFVQVFEGDCFKPLRKYSELLACTGVIMPESEPTAYEPAWCAWGYERKFTMDEIIGTLPKVQELGFKWATVDDGFQIAEGDWDLNKDRFPNGDADMKYLIDQIHSYGLKAQLWWAPLAVDPGTQFLSKYPNSIIINRDGKPQDITWWDSYYLSPVDGDVLAETKRLVEKFIGEYGFDGLKLDGQHLNAVPEDISAAHHPDHPDKCTRELPEFFKLIYETARDINSSAVIQNCPCGCCISVYNMPYANQTVSSDPLSSYQIRTKGYVLRALAPNTAYYGDHVELSDNGNDFPTQIGIGSVVGTKFTYPKDNPYAADSYLLTPEKETLVKKAVDIYVEKMLSLGEYVPGLYDLGWDFPETHVIEKDGKMHYAFYAKGQTVSSVELRGLEKGRTYKVKDYWRGVDYGEITATDNTILNAEWSDYLLLEVE